MNISIKFVIKAMKMWIKGLKNVSKKEIKLIDDINNALQLEKNTLLFKS